jgi:hypothetical protein
MINYYFACSRGFLQGMEIGLYNLKTYTVPAKCLGAGSVNDAVFLYDIYENGGVNGAFESFGHFYNLTYNFDKYCAFDTVLHDLTGFISNVNNDCSIPTVL